jgi:hypothetical protein
VAVTRLLAAGADPNASAGVQTPSGEVVPTTALIVAVVCGMLEAGRLMLDAGADPSRVDGDGNTPLMLAAQNGQLEMLRLLLGRGVALDVLDPRHGFTAFHFACFDNQVECAEALARAGCDVRVKTMQGFTGQQLAEAQGNKEAVRRLRALGRQPFVGVLVELAGLVGAAEHNGKLATVWCHTISCSLLHFFFVFCTMPSFEESLVCVAVEWHEVELTAPCPRGARCGTTCRRSSATHWSCWSRRRRAAARGSAWTCGRRTLRWRTCRPARGAPGRGGSDGSHRCSPVLFTFTAAPAQPRLRSALKLCSLARAGSR